MKPADKVALNITVQYVRICLTMGLTLFNIRLVLQALGAIDYGIFNLIAGLISMFAFFNGAMGASAQRFLSFHQGKKDVDKQRTVFTNSLLLHISIAIFIVIVLELVGLVLFDGFLKIPVARLSASVLVYHSMCINMFFTIITIPFISLLFAHENIVAIALLNTIDIILKLLATIVLFWITSDRLIIYSLLVCVLSLVGLLLAGLYCLKQYKECRIVNMKYADKLLMKEMGAFTGWNLFGALCSLARYEGLAILLNIFFGPIVNASLGLASQIAGQLSVFSLTMIRVINPQIVKSEGGNDWKRMLRLSMIASKFSFFLLACVAIPCIFEMRSVLTLWLKNVPEDSVIFCCLILIGALINQLTIGVEAALQAVGKVASYQIIVGLLLLCNIPIAYVLLNVKWPAYSVLVSYALIELAACVVRLVLAKRIAGLSIQEYFSKVFAPEIRPFLSLMLACFLITQCVFVKYRFLLTGTLSVIVFFTAIYFWGMSKSERIIIRKNLERLISKFR
ncbi:MAG: hypothetical protein QM726_11925 [Chitinophagaceae bacterium]